MYKNYAIFIMLYIFFFIGSELLVQDANGGLSTVDVAQNTSTVFMSNSTFVSHLIKIRWDFKLPHDFCSLLFLVVIKYNIAVF